MPPYGEDTLFANLTFANSALTYKSLRPAMKERIDLPKVWMSAKHVVDSSDITIQ